MSRDFKINPGDMFEFGFPDFVETIFAEYGPAIELAYTCGLELITRRASNGILRTPSGVSQ